MHSRLAGFRHLRIPALFMIATASILSCGDGVDRPDDDPAPVAPSPPDDEAPADGGLTVTVPPSDPFHSNENTLRIAGDCPTGFAIRLSGDTRDETSCADGRYEFVASRTTDGTYRFLVQGFSGETITERLSQTWIRDTRPPARPVLIKPKENPHRGFDSELILRGRCEPAASVFTRGPQEEKTRCNADGRFSFRLDRPGDRGAFSYRIYQRDRAGNRSVPLTFTWIIDFQRPPAPLITRPKADPVHTNIPSLRIEGRCTCTPADCVQLRGDLSADTSCTDERFDFDLEVAREGTFSIEIRQNHGGTSSPPAMLTWIFDSTPPPAPTITHPVFVPSGGEASHRSKENIVLRGRCEPRSEVILEILNEDDQTHRTPCENSRYTFKVHGHAGKTLELRLTKTDAAGNRSTDPTVLIWTREPKPSPPSAP